MNVQPNIQTTSKPVLRPAAQPVHFGLEPTGTFTRMADKGFKSLTANRTTQMLVEDLVGFGLMRTGVDLWRGKAYGNDEVNWPAGFERFGREVASIGTDNVLAGVVAWGMGKAIFDKVSSNKAAAFNNKFVEYPTLEAFQKAVGTVGNVDREKFLTNLSEQYFLKGHQAEGTELFNSVWKMSTDALSARKDQTKKLTKEEEKALSDKIEEQTLAFLTKNKGPKPANEIQNGFSYVQKMDQKTGEITKSFNLRALLEDVRGFSQHMHLQEAKIPGKSWKNLAEESIARTLKAKAVTIPVGLGVATAATFAVPFVISAASRKFMGIDYYPGEIGLRKDDPKDQPGNPQAPQKSFWERHAPYLTESIKKGNYWPLFWTLAPLPLAAGVLNTTRLKNGLPVLVKSTKEWKHLFDYQKGMPWTAQQQMSSLFAVLISSRLLNSRSDNEYRERVLDSFVGWGAWIMGTPLLNKVAGNLSDHFSGTKLVKADGSLRTRAEIEALEKMGEAGTKIAQKTLNRHVLMNVGTTLTTMGILGIAIPWMGVKMTQNNERRKQQLRDAQKTTMQPVQTAAPNTVKPWTASAQPSPFSALPTNSMRPGFPLMQPGLNPPANIWQMPMPPVGSQA